MPKVDFRFSFLHRARYHEIDRQDVVFNGHYLTYFSMAIVEFLRDLDSDYRSGTTSSGLDFHIVKSLVEYRLPIRFDQEIEIFVRISRIGRSSLTYTLEIHPRDEEQLLASGEVVWVAADRATRKSVPIPVDLTEKIHTYQGGEVAASG
jgi:acyl-CoA thioester hydrolase